MSEAPAKYIRIRGKTLTGEPIEAYYKTGEASIAENKFLSLPISEGGIASWSTTEVDEIPGDKHITCPKCEHTWPDPKMVHEVNED